MEFVDLFCNKNIFDEIYLHEIFNLYFHKVKGTSLYWFDICLFFKATITSINYSVGIWEDPIVPLSNIQNNPIQIFGFHTK